MENLKERRLEILIDTIRYYSEDVSRRCVRPNGWCKYSGETLGIDSDGCAIGRLLSPEARKKLDEIFLGSVDVYGILSNERSKRLIPEHIYELGEDFLKSLQELHDESSYWDSSGLTSIGSGKVNRIKQHFID